MSEGDPTRTLPFIFEKHRERGFLIDPEQRGRGIVLASFEEGRGLSSEEVRSEAVRRAVEANVPYVFRDSDRLREVLSERARRQIESVEVPQANLGVIAAELFESTLG